MNTGRLNLNKFFLSLKDEIYCIIKLRDFPHYSPGSDIDIFCYDIDKIAQNILRSGQDYVSEGFEILTHQLHQGRQLHIDFISDGKIEFRFDLYAGLPCYKNVCIKESYFESVIENRIEQNILCDECNYTIYIPCKTDDLIIRYIEYAEWFSQVPDKIGHIEYILSKSGIDFGKIPFIDKLHHYIELPECTDTEESVKILKRPGKLIISNQRFHNLPQRAYLSIRKRALQLLHLVSSLL